MYLLFIVYCPVKQKRVKHVKNDSSNSAIARDSRTAALALVQRRYQARILRSKVTEGHRQVILAILMGNPRDNGEVTEIASEIFVRTLIPLVESCSFRFSNVVP